MDTAAIDGLLEQAVSTGALPGVVAMVGDREGTLYEGCLRTAERGERRARAR